MLIIRKQYCTTCISYFVDVISFYRDSSRLLSFSVYFLYVGRKGLDTRLIPVIQLSSLADTCQPYLSTIYGIILFPINICISLRSFPTVRRSATTFIMATCFPLWKTFVHHWSKDSDLYIHLNKYIAFAVPLSSTNLHCHSRVSCCIVSASSKID